MFKNRLDLLTIIVLSTVFLSIAIWNLGMTQTPLTTWQPSQKENLQIDLGKVENVSAAYFLIKDGSADVDYQTGSSATGWSSGGTLKLEGYYSWNKMSINHDSQFIKLTFQEGSIEIAEIAVLGKDYQKLPIEAITSEGNSDQNLFRLTDEQELVQAPPTYVSETYFDEIYYVRTAEEYLRLQYPFEWTHPPLGKLIIASGILVFGYSPFGWRMMGVVFATLMIPLIYIVGKELFTTWIGAFTSAFLLTFDFMHFTMARMATVDTYVVFFSLASQLFFLIYVKNMLKSGWKTSVLPLLVGILFFALGFSTKWLVLYGFLGQLAILLVLRLNEIRKLKESLSAKVNAFLDRPFSQLYFCLLLAIAIYFLTYIPDMLAGRSLVDVLQLQGSMYIYHSTLNATHPFASPWFSWPFMWSPFGQHVPLWLCVSHLPANIVSTIVLMGNPAVWWAGFAFVILAVEEAVRKKDFACIFITVLFFFQWLPYVFISRITFIYHFYVNVPFLCLATAYFVNKYWSRKWGKVVTLAYFAGVVALFWLFYPAIFGTPTPTSLVDSLRWLGDWVF